jgi:putative SOS response-associated peptidase YedK
MPVILYTEEYSLWLEVEARQANLLVELLRPYPVEEMIGHSVSASINSRRNQGAE